jgi:exodeoxyribonuclease VII large subunit
MTKSFSLLELNTRIKQLLKGGFDKPVWIIAEISELKTNANGHCYLELIEKKSESGEIVARSRGIIWSYHFRMLKPYFENATGKAFSSGIKILFNAEIEFHESYGLSLVIKDIEPTFTVGEMEKRRQDIIKRLVNEGVFNMNKEIEFPLIPKNIAIISSKTAAGYEDFINQLENNEYSFRFHYKLFQANMQGENTEKSVLQALDEIYLFEDVFDIVVIIRGGGSRADLSWFDNYNIALHITQFPLPVLTGIGHEQDDSIADMVAWQRLKTPTAVADFIVAKCVDFKDIIDGYAENMVSFIGDIINEQHNITQSVSEKLSYLTKHLIENKKNECNKFFERMNISVKFSLKNNALRINNVEKSIAKSLNQRFVFNHKLIGLSFKRLKTSLDNRCNSMLNALDKFEKVNNALMPQRVLKRGYTLTSKNGKSIKSSDAVEKGDKIITLTSSGKFVSTIEEIL